jgi:hypothetical protein
VVVNVLGKKPFFMIDRTRAGEDYFLGRRGKLRKERIGHSRGDFMSSWLVWLVLYAHRHRSILGAAGHIIRTPANQLMGMGLKI